MKLTWFNMPVGTVFHWYPGSAATRKLDTNHYQSVSNGTIWEVSNRPHEQKVRYRVPLEVVSLPDNSPAPAPCGSCGKECTR